MLADFIERYKARFDIELPEMTAMLVNLRTTVIGRRGDAVNVRTTVMGAHPRRSGDFCPRH